MIMLNELEIKELDESTAKKIDKLIDEKDLAEDLLEADNIILNLLETCGFKETVKAYERLVGEYTYE